jgi:recombination protein RecR
MNLPSKLLDDAVNAFAALPGIGKKTALRLVLHLLNKDEEEVEKFSSTIARMRREIQICEQCHNIVDQAEADGPVLCAICANPSRNQEVVCVVANFRDLIAIESTNQYNGTYHILGGIISPVEGIGPEDLNLHSLIKRTNNQDVTELIMALPPTIEGDTTIFYISRNIDHEGVNITTIARGISFGNDLEYVDEFTLSRSLANRLPYENYLVNK